MRNAKANEKTINKITNLQVPPEAPLRTTKKPVDHEGASTGTV